MTENEVKLKQKQEDFEKIDKLIRQTLIFSRTKLKLLEALKKALLGDGDAKGKCRETMSIKVYVRLPKKYDKQEIVLLREEGTRYQKKVKVRIG